MRSVPNGSRGEIAVRIRRRERDWLGFVGDSGHISLQDLGVKSPVTKHSGEGI